MSHPIPIPRAARLRMIRPATGGFALVLTLLILSVLVIVVVSYLASMSAERATADAFASRARAEQMAQAGADGAMAVLREQIQLFPDSATTWDPAQTRNADGTTNGGTSLHLRAVPRDVPDPAAVTGGGGSQVPVPDPARDNRPNTPDPAGRQTFVMPLVSGVRQAHARLVADKGAAVPDLNTAEPRVELRNYAEMNPRRFRGDLQGWIGSPPVAAGSPAATAPRPVRAPWVEVKVNPRGTGVAADEVVTGHYAFWVEDESFRANLNLIAPPPVPLGANDPFRLLRPQNASLPGLLTFLGDGAADADARNILATRAVFPAALFPENRSLDQSPGVTTATADSLRFMSTLNSGGLNLSRHGSRRLNLNRIITDKWADTRVSANRINLRKELDQIIQTILFHAPKFGQRFYRAAGSSDAALNDDTVVSGVHPTIYLNKIAANLHDYVDKDSQPTVVMAGGAIVPTPKPILAMGGESTTNEVWAIGKEPVPLFTEYLLRVKQFAPLPGTKGKSANYSIEIDHYLEFWNMTNRDLTAADLGPNAYLSIADQPGWLGGEKEALVQPGNIRGNDIPNDETRDLLLSLGSIPNLVFKAGTHTVITTDPNPPPITGSYNGASFIPDRSRLFYVAALDSKRVFKGVTTHQVSGSPTLILDARPGPANINSGMDLDTEIVLGNDIGYLDSQQNAGALQAAMLVDGYNGSRITKPKTDTTQFHFRGAAPLGNLDAPKAPLPPTQTVKGSPFNSGDPRNHAEQLQFEGNTAAAASKPQQTRWQPTNSLGTRNDDQFVPRYNSLGFGNTQFLDPSAAPATTDRWGDTGSLQPGPDFAPANFPPPAPANDPSWRALTSIGQLGDLYDPVRATTATVDIAFSSGGGRTLRIGQRDSGPASAGAITDGKPWSKSREWAAWRLTDFFYAGDPRPFHDRDGNATDPKVTEDLVLPGLINPNGLLRDDGAALRAVLDGYQFLTNGDLRDPNAPASPNNPELHLTDPALSGKPLPASGRDEFLKAIRTRLADASLGPFFERGEISELDPFSIGTALTGVDMKGVNDRGREELFRRLVERITTRGNVFSVYVVGESIVQTIPGGPKRITGSARLKVTFQLVPVFDPAILSDETLDPNDATKVQKRFRPPDRYEIQVLQTST